MKKLYYLLILLAISGCAKDDDISIEEPKVAPPVVEGARKIDLKIDEGYDFLGYEVFSLVDSIVVGRSSEPWVPKTSSALIIMNKTGEEVLAIINVDSKVTEVVVNSENVSIALLDLLPAYHSLSELEKKAFSEAIKEEQIFQELVSTVGRLMEQQQPVYGDDPELLENLLALNSAIVQLYLQPEQENAKSTEKRVSLENIYDISSYLDAENDKIMNVHHSYLGLKLTSTTSDKVIYQVLDPNPTIAIYQGIPMTSFQDDYYRIELDHNIEDVETKNLEALFLKLAEMILTQVLEISSKSFKDMCGDTMISSMKNNGAFELVEKIVSDESNGINDRAAKSMEVLGNAGRSMLEDPACIAVVSSKGTWFRFILKKANMISRILSVIELVSNAVETAHLIMALNSSTQVKLNGDIQNYRGRLIKGNVGLKLKPGVIEDKYWAGEKIEPEVIVEVLRKIGNSSIGLEDFEVEWKIIEEGGEVDPDRTYTNTSGLTYTEWQLPSPYIESEVKLEAHLKDREGDPLKGSPIIIQTKVRPSLIGSWSLFTVNGVQPGEFYSTYDDNCPEIEDGKVTYHSDNITFTEDLKFTRSATSTQYDYNLTIDENCNITYRGNVLEYNDTWVIEDGSYKVEGGLIYITDHYDDYTFPPFPYKILSNGHLQLGEGEISTVYKRN